MSKLNDLKILKSEKKLDYQKEIINLDEKIKKEKLKTSYIKRKENKDFIKNNRKWFMILDIAIVFIILFNLGALTITHALVMKTTPDQIVTKLNPITNQTEEFIIKGSEPVVLKEINPIMAKSEGFIQHPESYKLFYSFLKLTIYWTILIFFYLFYRKRMDQYWKLEILTFYVLLYTIIMGTDFINDLGFWIGRLIY